jgi:hyperosmotically inducible periplasmic protein
MNTVLVSLVAVLLIFGCSKNRSENDQSSKSSAVEPDNTARNAADQDKGAKTAEDQSENEQDRQITQEVRKAVTSDDNLSTEAKNVKIITNDGTVTLRGPVKNVKEKSDIEAKAKQVAGVKKVDNQLEVAS